MLAGVLFAFHPGVINYAARRIWASSFTILGLMLSLMVLYQLRERPGLLRAILCGLVLGSTALFNPRVLAFVPLAMLWLLWRATGQRKETLAYIAAVAVTMIVVLLPWTYRNYVTFERILPVKGNFGQNFWQGNNPYVVTVGVHISPLKVLEKHLDAESRTR